MGYKDPARQREYQARRFRECRAEWLEANGPCRRCGSWDRLEVDHIDPAVKVSHNVWSWSAERRVAELKKCQVLCYRCHKAKTANESRRPITHGSLSGYNRGCRCDLCSATMKKKMVDYHRSHPRRMVA